MEDEGSQYLKELFSRSFFQYDIENKHFYVMHNLIHELAQSLTIDECLRIEEGKKCRFSRKARHLSLFSIELEPSLFQEFYRLRRLRTLALLPGQTPSIIRIPHQLFTKLRCLRVLLFSGGWLEELPDSIGNLKQLRFLGLFQCNIKELPGSLSRLYNLQTLRLNQCHRLHKLPRDFRNLINLRHLEAEPKLVSSIAGIGKLTSIQQLDTFLVRRDEGYQISELQHMTELRGKLQITGLENVTSLEEAKLSGLKNKPHLRMLELEWNADYGDHEPVLEGLQPHDDIEYLTINCYRGVRFPNWMGNPLFKNLVNISLQKCRKCEFLPPLGQLPYLKTLEIFEMHGVTKVGQEFFGDGNVKGFPSLEALMFYDLPNWEQWSLVQPGPIFPCLQKLGIWTCPKLKELPCLPVQLRDLKVSQAGCADMMIKSRRSSLHITGCPYLLFLPQDGLNTIKRLKIKNCEDLTRLPFGDLNNLNSLRRLEISGCAQLTLFPHQGLPTELKFLKICDCVNLGSLTGKLLDLLSLRELVIHDCPSLTSLPDELLTLPNLKKRNIMNCPNLKPPSSPAS
ncbi:hypothetical protein QJS10_CPB04g00495 [Acorus calamus]|uniref:Disease resistance RPP13-like protein 1 n=1 Tax=Acorus calamus TaxID=4465 RepID=A0AAV9F2C3_ACOCL|nr:hypothetical protein QJS10_CPB04g00495 [Acorus calamus]